MPWLRIEMQVEAPVAEALSDALLELGAQSVTIEDAWADTPDETPRYGEPGFELAASWRDSRLCALVDMQSDAGALTQAAALAAGLQAAPAYGVTLVEDDDWVRRTQSQFSPILIGKRLWIVPSWSEPPASEDAVVVRLDPGLAFGTGSHPTTRLMLTWLEGALDAETLGAARAARRVLDYGCGSGILALGSGKDLARRRSLQSTSIRGRSRPAQRMRLPTEQRFESSRRSDPRRKLRSLARQHPCPAADRPRTGFRCAYRCGRADRTFGCAGRAGGRGDHRLRP
jgi:hypothetical protein